MGGYLRGPTRLSQVERRDMVVDGRIAVARTAGGQD
jgi:hypothetical protein